MSEAIAKHENRQPAKKPETTIKSLLLGDDFKKQIQFALPKHLAPERFIRVALTAMTRMPKLTNCTKETFFKCLLDLSAMGLEPDGRRAHLIPFENKKNGTVECQLIVDYKGLVELAYRSGNVLSIHADKVCEHDEFDFVNGRVTHRVDFKKDRGISYAYYCVIQMKNGVEKHEVMSKREVEEIRDKSQGWIAFQKGWAKQSPWDSSPDEMGKKTVFRRASKWITLSPEIRDLVEKDDETLEEKESKRFEAAKPIFAPEPEDQTQESEIKPEDVSQEPIDTKVETSEPDRPIDKLMNMLIQRDIEPLHFENFLKRKKKLLSEASTLQGASASLVDKVITNFESLAVEFDGGEK